MIHYKLHCEQHHLHLIGVTLELESELSEYVLNMATWIPGSYLIRDFAKNIVSIQAKAGKKDLSIVKRDNATFCIPNPGGKITVTYQVYAFDRSVRGAHSDANHVFFNGTSLFFDIDDLDNQPITVTCERIKAHKNWNLATTLPSKKIDRHGFGVYQADDYETLIDHPVEIGSFSYHTFEVNDVEHAIAISGQHFADTAVLVQDVKKICETQASLFKNEMPFDRYLFLLTVMENGYGGLEHASSTALICSRYDLNNTNHKEENKDYTNLLGLFSHEYFHSWNIKRIKPLEFIPYNLKKCVPTSLLWVFEGFTSYYDELALLRSKVIPVDAYIELLSKNVTRFLHNPGREVQSLHDSSLDAWVKFYKADENAANSIANYYTNGALAALCIDVAIRQSTDNLKSLDNVMYALWERHGQAVIGVTHDTVIGIINEVAGKDLSDFVESMIQRCEKLPLEDSFRKIGLLLKEQYRHPKSDVTLENSPSEDPIVSLGIKCIANGFTIRTVLKDSLAEKCGLYANDQLIAINHMQLLSSNYDRIMETIMPGDEICIHVFRENQLVVCQGKVDEPLYKVAELSILDSDIFDQWRQT